MKPGIFMNAIAVELVAYGPEIVVNHFGTPVGALPAGASMVPVVSGPMPVTPAAAPVTPWQPTTGPGAPVQPQWQAPTGPASTEAAAPNYAFLNGPKRYLVNGVAYGADQLAAHGWPSEQISLLPPA